MDKFQTRKILITNDDGIDSDGLKRLVQCATKFGEVWVVAPESQRSAMSHSITLRTYIDTWEVRFPVEGVHAYAITGTPADCVRVGILNIMPSKPDVVFSGINYGYNSATDLQYSATAGAAFEARFQGIRAIAFSEGMTDCHEVTDAYLEQIMAELVDAELGYGEIWNVNFPDCKLGEEKGILRDRKVAHGSFYRDRYTEEKLENGVVRMRVNGIYNEDAEPDTDFRAIVDKYISIGKVSNIGDC